MGGHLKTQCRLSIPSVKFCIAGSPAENIHNNKQCNRSKTLDFYLQAGNLYASLKLDPSMVLFSFFRTSPEAKKMIILHEILTFIQVNS